ncbi:hypothetical protein ACRALDRAFT_212762 [Sodiomyces alcalophilus JCM 7366]|uniref:uncharacterized protein n=1 Tax=Sodiomyces alcalophilus JCM 7366 TaxID=591952 RepID=UPI0039B5C048
MTQARRIVNGQLARGYTVAGGCPLRYTVSVQVNTRTRANEGKDDIIKHLAFDVSTWVGVYDVDSLAFFTRSTDQIFDRWYYFCGFARKTHGTWHMTPPSSDSSAPFRLTDKLIRGPCFGIIKIDFHKMPDYTLYSYFRSSCSARLRIALNLKNLSYDLVPVNILQGEQLSESHRALNPSASVPLLLCHTTSSSSPSDPFKITQSVAALEYLEEAHPSSNPTLLPSNPRTRAIARSLALTVACDIQPVTNLRVAKRVRNFGAGDAQVEEWMRGFMSEGLAAYEALVASSAGTYSVGDDVSIADCCLVPAVWNARRYGVDLSPFPVVNRVMARLEELPAVKKAGYFVQPDTPESLRGKAD